MTAKRESRRFFQNIGFRISSMCWLVTLLTLAVYVVVSLPQQKKDLLEALRSKAQGVSSSLQDVAAGAAVSEDYSTVVDHCIQVLRGDDAIEYLVVTKTDGFSVIVDRKGWRTETLSGIWRPAGNENTAALDFVPLFGKRVFRFSRPFDYLGIRWGWISVGLSTAAYDRSVNRVYQRTSYLALLSAAVSMLIAFAQARRLVKPIVTLKDVVRQVAEGDLSARAEIRTADEIADLATSFNIMTDTIMQRNRILESVRFAGQQLLSADDWTGIVEDVLEKIGAAADVSSASLFENDGDSNGIAVSRKHYEWVRQESSSNLEHCQSFRWEGARRLSWAKLLQGGEEVVADFAEDDDAGGGGTAIRPVILVPIHVGGAWWGLLGLDECLARHVWGEAEKDSFRAVAGMFGAAITRQRAQQALVESKDHLELRVLERTRELQAEVSAKEEAHARLAEAQQHLMAVSRQAGMAEVATGVLHNVGNVLNSVNVSATLVATKIRESRVGNLVTLTGMLQEHSEDLGEFLNRNPKGQRVLPYLTKLGSHLEDERQVMCRELDLLTGHIGHIKEIVSVQQSYAKVSGLIELVPLAELVEDAISIVMPGLQRHGIQLERNFEAIQPVAVDKHAVLQILLNLLRNAKQAIDEANQGERIISVRTYGSSPSTIRVSVTDTGVGLPPENLTRIFSHGFTTRHDGHGFGLHSGANSAKQMGGSLWAESAGTGLGATFVLELPLAVKKQAKEKQVI